MCYKSHIHKANLLPGCWNNVDTDCICSCERKTTKLFSYSDPLYDQGVIFTHKSCEHNEKVALDQRHQVDDGARASPEAYRKSLKHIRKFIRPLTPASHAHVISRSRGDKRKLLLRAEETLKSTPLDQSDGRVKMFLKDDKYHDLEMLGQVLDQPTKLKFKAPRCIQYRNKRYCLEYATFAHPYADHIYSFRDDTDTHVFAKGRNLTQMASDLRTKYESFTDPHVYLIDCTNFDAHMNGILKRTVQFPLLQCFDNDPLLKQLLSMQKTNRGSTKNGSTYTTVDTEMSGEMTTDTDDSVANYGMSCSIFESKGARYLVYICGDDSVIITEGKVDVSPCDFEEFGMVAKIEVVTEFEDIEFCQTRPVFDGTSWRMVRNPLRVLARMQWTAKKLDRYSPQKLKAYMASLGDCEVATGLGLPIGQYIGTKLANLTRRRVVVDALRTANLEFVRPGKATLTEPTEECRLSYQRTWGLSIEQQLHIEQMQLLVPTLGFHEIEEFPHKQ